MPMCCVYYVGGHHPGGVVPYFRAAHERLSKHPSVSITSSRDHPSLCLLSDRPSTFSKPPIYGSGSGPVEKRHKGMLGICISPYQMLHFQDGKGLRLLIVTVTDWPCHVRGWSVRAVIVGCWHWTLTFSCSGSQGDPGVPSFSVSLLLCEMKVADCELTESFCLCPSMEFLPIPCSS